MAGRDALDPRIRAMSALLQVEQALRAAESVRDLGYIATNDVRSVFDYRQAVLWSLDDLGRPDVKSMANVSEVDSNTPFMEQLTPVLDWLAGSGAGEPRVMRLSECTHTPGELVQRHLSEHLLYIPLYSAHGLVGGLLYSSDMPFREGVVVLAGLLGDAIGHAWGALAGSSVRSVQQHFRRYWRRYVIAVTVLLLLPVRLFVLAPAEVVPATPFVIAAPMAGVVERIAVDVNDTVQQGQLLYEMESTSLESEVRVAQKAVDVARAEYLRQSQQSFSCDECKARLPELSAIIAREQAKLDSSQRLLALSQVHAPTAGVVTFSARSEWEGKPVSTGERVMTISDPAQVKLSIKLPVGDAIALDDDASAVFYPNVSPLDSYSVDIVSEGYEALPVQGGALAFILEGHFDEDVPPRLGWQGTVKLYGHRAPLIYQALRRPLAWLRRTLGW